MKYDAICLAQDIFIRTYLAGHVGHWTRTGERINICHIFFNSMELVRIVIFTQFTSRHVYLAGFVL